MHFKDPLTKLHVQIFTIGQRMACSSFVLAFPSLANLLISRLQVKVFPSLYSCAGYAKMLCSLWFRVSASIFQNIQFLSKSLDFVHSTALAFAFYQEHRKVRHNYHLYQTTK